jgi:hypothetical protein
MRIFVRSSARRAGRCIAGRADASPGKGRQVAATGIHHVDLAVADVDASLAIYLDRMESDRRS